MFEGPKEALGVVWISTWDSADEAREILREIDESLSQALTEGLTLPGKTRAAEVEVVANVADIIAQRLQTIR